MPSQPVFSEQPPRFAHEQSLAEGFSSSRFALALIVCLAAYVVLVAAQMLVFGSYMGQRTYEYFNGFQTAPLLAGCLIAAAAVACDMWIPSRLALAFWFAAGLAAQLALHSFMFGQPLGELVGRIGFYDVSTSFKLHDILGRFRELRGSWPAWHPGANMPGMLMLYKAIEVFVTNRTAIALVTLVISNLGAILLYYIVQSFYGSRELALRSAVLYLFIPSRIYFLPMLNTLSPVPILFALLMLVWFLDSSRDTFAVLMGIAIYASVLFDPETLAAGLFFVAAILKSLRTGKVPVSRLGRLGIFGIGGFAAAYALMRIVYGFDLFGAVELLLHSNSVFALQLGRRYSPWLYGNPYEFSIAAGLLASVCCVAYVTWALVEADPSMSVAQGSFLACLYITVGALVISGVIRGEISRLWIFLMPFVQVVAADFCARFRPYVYRIVLGGAIIQTAITIGMLRWLA